MTEPNQPLTDNSPVIKQLIKALGIELEGITELVLLIRPQALVTARVRFYPADSDFEKLVERLVAERRTAKRIPEPDDSIRLALEQLND